MVHIFDVEIATLYGVNAAILLQNIYFWCEHNRVNGKCLFEDNYWTFNSRKAFAELFPYMSEHQISTALQKLIDNGLIVTGNFNKSAYDRTLWYAVTENGKSIIKKCEMEDLLLPNGLSKNGSPIPDINKDINTDVNTDIDTDISSSSYNYNPYGDHVEVPDIIEEHPCIRYALASLKGMSEGNIIELSRFIGDMPDDLIRYAIDESCGSGAANWNYTHKVLKSWRDKGYKSVDQVQAARDERQKNKSQQPQQVASDDFWGKQKFY